MRHFLAFSNTVPGLLSLALTLKCFKLVFSFSNSFDLVTSICKIRALNAFLWIFAALNFCFPQNRIYYVAVLLRSPWLSVGIHIGLFSLLSTSSFVMETDSRLTHCGRLTFFVQKVKNNHFSKAERTERSVFNFFNLFFFFNKNLVSAAVCPSNDSLRSDWKPLEDSWRWDGRKTEKKIVES